MEYIQITVADKGYVRCTHVFAKHPLSIYSFLALFSFGLKTSND